MLDLLLSIAVIVSQLISLQWRKNRHCDELACNY